MSSYPPPNTQSGTPRAAGPNPQEPPQLNPVAGIIAYMLPGLGYVFYGEFRRAALVFVGVGGLFFGGLLMGGISTIDRYEDRWWFILQCGVGPATFAIDRIHQTQFKLVGPGGRPVSPTPGTAKMGYQVSLGKVNEVAALSCGLAGMLNLIAVVDCLWRSPKAPSLGGRPGAERDRKPLPKL